MSVENVCVCVWVRVSEHDHVLWEDVQACVRVLCTDVYLCVCWCVFTPVSGV